jgi:nicotinamidase-related amidase
MVLLIILSVYHCATRYIYIRRLSHNNPFLFVNLFYSAAEADMSSTFLENAESTALIVVDLQPLFTRNITDNDYEGRVTACLTFMRSKIPPCRIVHLRANYSNSSMSVCQLRPEAQRPTDSVPTAWAKEEEGEVVVTKSTINGFHETNLDSYLSSQGVKTIYLIGMLTAACVHETAIGGMNRGYFPILIEECCIDKTPERQAAVFLLYKDYLYQTVSLDQLLIVS